MEFIDEDYRLYFATKNNEEIIINGDLLEQLKHFDHSSLPENTKIIQSLFPFFELSFNEGSSLIIYYFPIKCKININQSKKEILLYSLQHLKLILLQLNEEYQNPYFYSNYFKKEILINGCQLQEKDFAFETEIEIKDKKKEEYTENIKLIYKELKSIYANENELTYEFISPNFNIYYRNLSINLKDKFNYIYSNNRKSLESEFSLFLDDDSEMIYPICGPNNIGKTITSLRIQKLYYLQGIKSLYLNLKFYFNKPSEDIDLKINTLIKECFYFVENEEELVYLYDKFQKTKAIVDALNILYIYLISKKIAPKKFFIIIDNYQLKYDSFNILDSLSGIKVFLLSPVNDKDVQNNLISIQYEKALKLYKVIEEKQLKKIIRYKYYESLFEFSFFNSVILFENKIRDKVKEISKEEVEENKIEEKFKFIFDILSQFNLIPKYVIKFIYHYFSIYDFLFDEFKKVFFKLIYYESDKIIDITKIDKLLKNKNIIQKTEIGKPGNKDLSEEEYLVFIKYIPLKYINYFSNNKGKLYFYYSFPLFEQILNEYNEYFKSKEIFYDKNTTGSQKGKAFEKIIITQLKIFNYLNIDGHLEVNTIINMDFTKNYELLDKKYIQNKKNILITQKNEQGKDYDFAIYKPKNKQLILFQAKYQIDRNLINHKNSYIETSKDVLKNFRKSFDDNSIENVYLLYISSKEYNKRKKLKNLLSRNQINCLFYSVRNKYFSFNFEDKVDDIECTNSFLLLPELKNYIEQGIKNERNSSQNNNASEEDIFFLNKKIKKNYNKDKIYEQFEKNCILKTIGFTLGKLIKIDCFNNERIKINRRKEYIIIFSLKDDDDSIVDFDKPIGLIYYEKEKEITLEITQNKRYDNYEELFQQFSINSHYGIGEKR